MYQLQDKPDSKVTLKNGSEATPVATLKDEYGGISHIIEDDHCNVLVNGSADRGFRTAKHWYPEAVESLKTLPTSVLGRTGRIEAVNYEYLRRFK